MYEDRIGKLRKLMENQSIDVVVVTSEPNMRYLSGYSGVSLERLIALIITRDLENAILIVPRLEEKRVEENCKLRDYKLLSYSDVENPVEILQKVILESSPSTIGIEETIQFKYVYPTINKIPDTKFIMIDELMYSLRIIKEQEEIDLLKKAAEINNEVLAEAIKNIRPGISEKNLAVWIKNYAIDIGADDVLFTLIQSGVNSSLPHQEPTNKKIQEKEVVVLDIGVRCGGYVSDITRTVVLDTPSNKHLEIFNIVLRAQLSALETVREGVKAEEVDRTARKTIESAGYGEYFIHRTGHGIGLEIHEPPFIKIENKQILRAGMVFTVEPGIYLPGEFGVRIEDNVIVTEGGYINLTSLPKSLHIKDY